jgi:hypothetical protein
MAYAKIAGNSRILKIKFSNALVLSPVVVVVVDFAQHQSKKVESHTHHVPAGNKM